MIGSLIAVLDHHFYFPALEFLVLFDCKWLVVRNTFHSNAPSPKTFSQFDFVIISSCLWRYPNSSIAPTPTLADRTSRICPLILISVRILLIYNDQTRSRARIAAPGAPFLG